MSRQKLETPPDSVFRLDMPKGGLSESIQLFRITRKSQNTKNSSSFRFLHQAPSVNYLIFVWALIGHQMDHQAICSSTGCSSKKESVLDDITVSLLSSIDS